MLFSATWFARIVATATARPSVVTTRSAAARKNFVPRPGPVAAIGAAAEGSPSDPGVGELGVPGFFGRRGETIVAAVSSCEGSVSVFIVVGGRIVFAVLVLVRDLAERGPVERHGDGD